MQVFDSGLIIIRSFVTVVVFMLTEMGLPSTSSVDFKCF